MATSGPYPTDVMWIAERGARLAWRDEEAHRQHSTPVTDGQAPTPCGMPRQAGMLHLPDTGH